MADFVYDIGKEYRAFLKEYRKTPMHFHMGNDVLYEMCRKYPHHDDVDIIVSKVWLIGRSYAASIERRKTGDNNISDDFFYDTVAPVIKRRSRRIDGAIDELNSLAGGYKENAGKVLTLHKYMVETFTIISGLEKRSLAAKYLHFHCPDKVLIYDSRAQATARKTVHRPDIPKNWKSKYDEQYADFFVRVITIADEIEEKTGEKPSPRDIDNFLLHHMEKQ